MGTLSNPRFIVGPSVTSLSYSDNYVILDASSGNISLTLPEIVTDGATFIISRIDLSDSFEVVAQVSGSDTINGSLTNFEIESSSINTIASKGDSWYISGASSSNVVQGRIGMASFTVSGTTYMSFNSTTFGVTTLYPTAGTTNTARLAGATSFSPAGQPAILSIVPAVSSNQPDKLLCTKKILSLRYYAQVGFTQQIGLGTGAPLNARLAVDGVTTLYQGVKAGSSVFGVTILGIGVAVTNAFVTAEWTNIPANTTFAVGLTNNALFSTTVSDTGSYGIITYEL